MADSKISALSSGGLVQAGDNLVVARAGASLKVTPAGIPVLVYRYTVTGSDKTSIDTGADTPDAGSNDWTNGDLLEVFIYARTDESVLNSTVNIVLNNDTSSIYDAVRLIGQNSAASSATNLALARWFANLPGASSASGVFGSANLVCPNYSGTVGNKSATMVASSPNQTTADAEQVSYIFGYRSTTAITRLKIIPDTAGKKFKVGSQLLIYKRLAS